MDELNEFLAAPESVLKNEREVAKARQRKAAEKAREEREKASKRTEPPSVEDMLGDLVRVAEDPETNPFYKDRTISRKRYRRFGWYPVEYIDRQFGQFNYALEVAGLRDRAGTRLWRSVRANASRREHAARYLERYVAPYVGHADEFGGRSYRMLSISDTHSQMMCPFTWLSFLSAVRDLQPDGVLFNGDTLDTVQLSRHPKIPGWTPELQSELDFKKAMFREVRKVHDGDIWDTGGNHDLADRLAMHLTQVSPALAGLRCLRVDELMGLGEHDVKLFHGGTILSPAGEEDAKTGFLMFGFYRIHHGTRLGTNPALDELKDAGRSGQSGHVHRASLAFGTSERDEGLSWMCTPMGARHSVGRAYVKGTNTGWQRGFGYCELFPDGGVHQYPVVVRGERVVVEGFCYDRPDWLDDPEPEGVWLDDERYQLA